jgi:Kdo2-lipid IVA lauroyltransferase/acyltransferase
VPVRLGKKVAGRLARISLLPGIGRPGQTFAIKITPLMNNSLMQRAALPWWLRALSRLPMPVIYALVGALVVLARRVFRFKLKVATANVRACFPELDSRAVDRVLADHYRQTGEVIAEVIKGARLKPSEFAARVQIRNLAAATDLLAKGRPVLLVAAHQGNWEWVLQALSIQLGYPLDVGYKPIKSGKFDLVMNTLRTRFGAHLVPAKELLGDLLRRRHIVRGIAMLADQEPTTSDHQHWVTFLGRDTAFYMGPEQMARATRYASLFVALRRVRRGYYEIGFSTLADPGEQLAPGEFTTRYARLVESGIRAAPADWTWGHRRWKLKRGLYSA